MQHRLIRWLPAAVAPVVIAGVVAVPLVAAATPPALPTRSPQQVLELVAKAKDIAGFSGTVAETSNLMPSVPSIGAGSGSSTASALDLISGTHTAKVDVAGATKQRVAILDSSAERDVVRNGSSVWTWDSKTSSATHVTVAGSATPDGTATTTTPAALAEELLAKVDGTTAVSVDPTQTVAGQAAYTLVLTPRTSDTTIGSVRIAIDGTTGLPLDVQVLARGASSPAFEVGFTDISYAVPAASTFDFTPPSDAKVTTKTLTPGDRPTTTEPRTGPRPSVQGSGWASVVTLAASEVPSGLASSSAVKQLAQKVTGGLALETPLVNVLLTTDGRVLAGAVPLSTLQSDAG